MLQKLPRGIASRPRMRAGLVVVGGNVVGAGAAFLAAIVAVRTLSLDEFAAFGVSLAVNSLAVQFADFGLGTIAIAETADSADPAAAREKLRSLARHRVRTALVVGILVTGIVLLLPSLAPYRAAATIGAGGAVLGSLAFFFIWSLQGERSFAAAGTLQAVQGVLRLGLVGACAIAGFGGEAMMVGYAILAPGVIAALGGLLLFTRPPQAAGLRPSATGTVDVDIGRRRVMALTGVFAALVINGDVLLLTALAGEHEVAAYTAAWRFSSGVLLVNTAIASAILPFIASAPNAWVESKYLVRRGLLVAAAWFVVLPLLAVIGPLLLGDVGDDARSSLIVLLVAFAIDGFYFVVYQIYLRARRERLLLGIAVVEFATMALVTLLLRDEGALAPAYGQLAARVVVCVIVATPIVLAAFGRCTWFAEAGEGDRPLAPEPPSPAL
jgi:O-antigen/teichoic acid export membrane protein